LVQPRSTGIGGASRDQTWVKGRYEMRMQIRSPDDPRPEVANAASSSTRYRDFLAALWDKMT
jgi:hypothetical protein